MDIAHQRGVVRSSGRVIAPIDVFLLSSTSPSAPSIFSKGRNERTGNPACRYLACSKQCSQEQNLESRDSWCRAETTTFKPSFSVHPTRFFEPLEFGALEGLLDGAFCPTEFEDLNGSAAGALFGTSLLAERVRGFAGSRVGASRESLAP